MTKNSSPVFKQEEGVQWKWGSHLAYGQIEEIYTERVTQKIKGATVTRNATPEEPAYLIRQENGQIVLKSHSELQPIE